MAGLGYSLIYSVLVLPELPELGSQREEDFYINLFTFIRYTQQEKKAERLYYIMYFFLLHIFLLMRKLCKCIGILNL